MTPFVFRLSALFRLWRVDPILAMRINNIRKQATGLPVAS